MTAALILFVLGLALSAFFSGSETGFYRASRVRLRLDAMSGDRIARWLIRLANHPDLFVATTLIGNNMANFLTSFAIVVGTATLWPQFEDSFGIVPTILSPVVFVYGELLPKNLFFHAPNRMLRWGGPFLLIWALLLLPASLVLWLLARGISVLVGEAPERLHLTLARNELQQVFEEGHQVGILRPAQQVLAHGMLSLADTSLVRFCLPLARFPSVALGTPTAVAMRIAQRHQVPWLLVSERRGKRLLGYVRLLDLHRGHAEAIESAGEMMTIEASESPVVALTMLQSRKQPVARVVNDQGQMVGLVQTDHLVDALLR